MSSRQGPGIRGQCMQDKFYADKRDLVKWAVLHRLAEIYDSRRILQIAFYRPSEFANIVIDGEEHSISQEVLFHFRDLRTVEKINSEIKITVFNKLFENRISYLKSVKIFLTKFKQERCVVFLDPDTGLQPGKPNLKHVLESEAMAIWEDTKSGDIYVFYQHQNNRAGWEWIEPKRKQLENTLSLNSNSIKIAHGPKIAHDVVFFYAQKP
jgi:hypothetical protein